MEILVTGGCGFVGSNIVVGLLERGWPVTVLDNLSRVGAPQNLEWLKTQGKFRFIRTDTRDAVEVEGVLQRSRIDCVFHLAGQVAMTTSLQNPRLDFETNVVGSINLLEAVRKFAPTATVVYASSNKVYGELEDLPLVETETRYQPADGSLAIDESARLDFRTPYGCSKGAADQYMLEYARNFGLRTVVFRHSTIYGGRQISTFDQGWVGWFCRQALLRKTSSTHRFTINGNGKQVRDLLHVSDAVRCYLAAHECIERAAGQVFNIGGGYQNSMSLLELLHHLEKRLDIRMSFDNLPWRSNDQRFFVADNGKANRFLNWLPTVSKEEGIDDALQWERSRGSIA